ncbi:hypothetical protein [Yokenella regensburgei]|uniref:hypothetical protein n=1 Tax=Yokenella regensburgei TaxID=158877 RepID=UPI0020774C3E|nr:hypothetical protein [Yokenella regensburgei]
MFLLNTYENEIEAEEALQKITGSKGLASERDGTIVIYNLFGEATWNNFYKLDMYNLKELEFIIKQRGSGIQYDAEKHSQILKVITIVAMQYNIKIPLHWNYHYE